MVPGHPFNEMKPNSGGTALNRDESPKKKFRLTAARL
jgi:hypothetical protein